jgi:signal peptidase I
MFQRLSTDLLQSGYGVRFRPGGFSMYPTIRDGEAVTVEPIRAHEVRRGDILLYRRERRVIAHRVVGIALGANAKRVFTLRGDSLSSCDAPVKQEQVLGRVVSVERKGRWIKLGGRRARIRSAVYLRAARLRKGLTQRFGILRSLRNRERKGCVQLEKG